MNMRWAAAAFLAHTSLTAAAATTTANFGVQANVMSACSVAAGPLAFGIYTPGGGTISSTSSIRVSCTKSTFFSVGIDSGTTPGATYTQRLVAHGANTLQYNLYTSGSYGSVWGDGSGTTIYETGTGTGTATPVTLTVYGQLPDNAVNRSAAAGTYSDTVLVVVVY